MLNLPTPSDKVLNEYYEMINAGVTKGISDIEIGPVIKQKLNPKLIKDILTGTPSEIKEINDTLIPELIKDFILDEYTQYFKIKRKKLENRNDLENQIYSKYNPTFLQLSSVFNYDKFISRAKETSYKLASMLSRNTCTYCNRLYTVTIVKVDEMEGGEIEQNEISRPEFDHWFSKSKYPLLALSFYNLIPSCNVCNSSLKGDANFSLDTHPHPYIDKVVNEFKFSFNYESVHENNVRINVNAGSKAETTLKEFKIQEVYNAHSNLELKDLLDLKFKYSEDYIKTLFGSTFKNLEVSEEEAYRLIFGIEHDEEHFHKRPFSKFKKDILEELKKIER